MKKQMTSVLGLAAVVLLVVGLAVWTVAQLTGGEAAAERLPTIVVGRDAAPAVEGTGFGGTSGTWPTGAGNGTETSRTTATASTAGLHSTSSPAAGGTTRPGASTPASASMPTSTAPPGTTSTAPTSTGTTMPAASAPAGGGGQSTATSTTATTRMVVPDPVREHDGGHTGGGMSTPGSMGTTPGSMGTTPMSGGSWTSGSMGH